MGGFCGENVEINHANQQFNTCLLTCKQRERYISILIGVSIHCTLQKIQVYKLKNTRAYQPVLLPTDNYYRSIQMSTFSIDMTATVLTLIGILINFTNCFQRANFSNKQINCDIIYHLNNLKFCQAALL